MLQALRDEVIVQPLYETKAESGIVIPESARKYKQYDGQVLGHVVSVGSRHKLGAVPGDLLIWRRHEGRSIKYQGVEYLAVKERWVMGVVAQ